MLKLAEPEQRKLWHGPGPLITFCCHLDSQPQCMGEDKEGSSHASLPVGWASQVGQALAAEAWGTPEAVLEHMCTSVKVTEILKNTEWGITGHIGAPVLGPQDNEGWKQSADGPPFGTETTYWLYFDLTILTFNLTGLSLVLRPLTYCRLDDHEVPLSTLLTLSNAASPPHYCNPFPRIRSERHALCSSWWGWKL